MAGCLPHASEGKGESQPGANESGSKRALHSGQQANGSSPGVVQSAHAVVVGQQQQQQADRELLADRGARGVEGRAVMSPAAGSTPGGLSCTPFSHIRCP